MPMGPKHGTQTHTQAGDTDTVKWAGYKAGYKAEYKQWRLWPTKDSMLVQIASAPQPQPLVAYKCVA